MTRFFSRWLRDFEPPRPWWDERPSTASMVRELMTAPGSNPVGAPQPNSNSTTADLTGKRAPLLIINDTRQPLTVTGYGETVTLQAGESWTGPRHD